MNGRLADGAEPDRVHRAVAVLPVARLQLGDAD